MLGRNISALLVLLLAPPAVSAGEITGTVRNGTTGKPAGAMDVILIQLQGGMEVAGTTKTDPQGRYLFDHPQAGRVPMLVRVVYRGVNYHQSVPPGRNSADVEIFEASARAADLAVRRRVLLLQPEGETLIVGEEFSIENRSSPRASYYRADGSFEFSVPEGGQLNDVSAAGPAGMAVVQGTVSKGPNRFAIAFPLRPGENVIRLSYQLPYPANHTRMGVSSPYGIDRVMVWAPATLTVDGPGLLRAANEQGGTIYSRDSVAAGAVLTLDISGTAPSASAAPAGQSGEAGTASNMRQVPGSLDSLKPILIAGFAALFALGLFFLWRQPATAEVRLSPGDASPGPCATPPAAHAAAVERQVQGSLEGIKDTLLRLELRRQAGTISEAEYAEQRGRAERMLGELLND